VRGRIHRRLHPGQLAAPRLAAEPGTAIARGQYGNQVAPAWNDLFLRGWLTGAQADRWIAQHHYAYWIAYQSHGRLQVFQFTVAAMLLAAAAAMTLAAAWLLRRDPAG
jgi:hypothetical protein